MLDSAIVTMDFGCNHFMLLVEGKREDEQLHDSMPEAVSEAIALSEVMKSMTLA